FKPYSVLRRAQPLDPNRIGARRRAMGNLHGIPARRLHWPESVVSVSSSILVRHPMRTLGGLMKAPLKLLALSLLILFVPFATAQAQAPSLSTIPNISVNAGATVIANVVAVDPLGRNITLTSSLPSFVTLNTPTSGVGVIVTTLTLAPGAINVGNYTAAVTASAGGVTDIEIFGITVNTSGTNQVPVVSAPPLREVTDGSNLPVPVNASGPAGVLITLLGSLPSFATLEAPGSGLGSVSTSISLAPPVGSAGTYHASITASSSGVPPVIENFDIIVTGTV